MIVGTVLGVAVDVGYSDVINALLRWNAIPCKGVNSSDTSELAVAARAGEFSLLGQLLLATNPRWREVRRVSHAVRAFLDDIIVSVHGINGGLGEVLSLNRVAAQEEKFIRNLWEETREVSAVTASVSAANHMDDDATTEATWDVEQRRAAEAIFNKVDLDGGGTIDPEEFRIFLEALGFKDLYGILFERLSVIL